MGTLRGTGGRRGIRTHGSLKDFNGFRGRPIRPLWQPSEINASVKFDVLAAHKARRRAGGGHEKMSARSCNSSAALDSRYCVDAVKIRNEDGVAELNQQIPTMLAIANVVSDVRCNADCRGLSSRQERRARKNSRSSSPQRSASMPATMSTRWLRTAPSSRWKWLLAAPAFGSVAP